MIYKFIDLIFDGITKAFILRCFISIIIGGFISFSLILSGQNWAKSFSNITTFCILPLIGLVITTVISGNISLSLGMVGALSIVRFRNPVRSPLELSIYFGAITMGIAAAVSILWLIFLFGSFILTTIVLLSAHLFSKKLPGKLIQQIFNDRRFSIKNS